MSVKGIASTFEEPENHDSFGDIIAEDAFDESVAERGPKGLNRIKMLWMHRFAMGMPKAIEKQSTGLFWDALATRTRENEERLAYMRDRVVDGLSIGYRTKAFEWVDTVRTRWGRPVRRLLKVDLHEVSPVIFPANDNARTNPKSLEPMLETRSGLLVPCSSRCMCDVSDEYKHGPGGADPDLEFETKKNGDVVLSSRSRRKVLSRLAKAKAAVAEAEAILNPASQDDDDDPDDKAAKVAAIKKLNDSAARFNEWLERD